MKNVIKTIPLFLLVFATSCRTTPEVVIPNFSKEQPNVLNKETKVTLPNEANVNLPKGSYVSTDKVSPTEAVLEEDVKVEVPLEILDIPNTPAIPSEDSSTVTAEKPSVIVSIPKNTTLLLPPNTNLSVKDSTRVTVEKGSEAILPKGSEVLISKINWYAIAFFGLLIILALRYYLSGKWQDKNQDGFADEEIKEPKKEEKTASEEQKQ